MKRLLIGTALAVLLTSSASAQEIPPQLVPELQSRTRAWIMMIETINTCSPWFDVSRVQKDLTLLIKSGAFDGPVLYRKELSPFIDDVVSEIAAAKNRNAKAFCQAVKAELDNSASAMPEK